MRRDNPVVGYRLLLGVHAGLSIPWWFIATLDEWHDVHEGRGQADGVASCIDDPGNRLRDVSADVRNHHTGTDRGRIRRSYEVLGDVDLHVCLVARRIRADRTLGVGAVRLARRK